MASTEDSAEGGRHRPLEDSLECSHAWSCWRPSTRNALFRKRAGVRLQQAADLSRSVLASVSSEIVVLDRDGRVVAANEAWTRSLRRARHPLLC
jgi:PAS domain-containing protein